MLPCQTPRFGHIGGLPPLPSLPLGDSLRVKPAASMALPRSPLPAGEGSGVRSLQARGVRSAHGQLRKTPPFLQNDLPLRAAAHGGRLAPEVTMVQQEPARRCEVCSADGDLVQFGDAHRYRYHCLTCWGQRAEQVVAQYVEAEAPATPGK